MSTITKQILVAKQILGLAAAGTLALVLAGPAVSAETTGRSVASEPTEDWDTGRASGDLSLPQLPWMTSSTGEPVTAVGMLGPELRTIGPFLLHPAMPGTRLSASGSKSQP